jgi:predicted transposase YbfD/YdcC
MPTQEVALTHYFADLTDPRINRTKKHQLLDILAITLCATLAGADTWEEVERFGKAKHDWLKRFLQLPNGIPSHDTLNRVFAALDPKPFADAVGRWMAAVGQATGWKQVAIDGKAARSAPRNTFSGCLHLVSAWATENRLILGQEAVADGSNEIAAIPQLLRVLELKGALVTIDAAGTQVEIAEQIREQGGDYLLAVKGNQPTLQGAVQAVFDRACAADFAGVRYDMDATVESGHGREEERYVTVIYEPEGLPAEWPDVAAVVLVGRERKVNGKNVSTSHYYLTSRRAKARRLGEAIRGHWGIENGLHWVLDVAFGEDANSTRAGHAGANLGLVRRLALSLLKQDPSKGSIKAKRLSAALDDNYLLRILQGIPEN